MQLFFALSSARFLSNKSDITLNLLGENDFFLIIKATGCIKSCTDKNKEIYRAKIQVTV